MNDNEKKPITLNEHEESILLDHDYDGIREFDYPLPSWWKTIWLATALYSIPYFMYYHVADAPDLNEELALEMIQINKLKEAAAQDVSIFKIDEYNTWKSSRDFKAEGKVVYEENCLSCHEAGGKGGIGPNLTDNYWIHAKGDPETIFPVIRDGFEDNGMPAWGELLTKDELFAAMAYIISIQGTNPADAKEAQGKLIVKE